MKLSFPKAGDINAGLLVALVGIPQCLAYAMLSGIPPMYGLVTAAIPGMIAAIFGRSPAVTVGPTNTTGLIILASLAPWADQPDLLLTAMATLAALAGLARLSIVYFRAERIFDYVPEAVMVGFATGAAIIIAIMQLDEFLGAPFQTVRNVFDELHQLMQFQWAHFSLPSAILALAALASVIFGKKYAPKWPIPLLVLVASLLIIVFDLTPFTADLVTIGQTTTVSSGWPELNSRLPSFQMITNLIIPSFAVAFIGSLELIVTLRHRHEQKLLSSELKSQGLSNIVGSFSGAFPASTSLTRSVLLDIGGAQTRWAPFIAAVVLFPIILFGGEAIRQIPQAVIAGLLIATAISMINVDSIRQMLRVNSETRLLFLVTVISTLLLDFHIAVLLGACLGIVFFLYHASKTCLFLYQVEQDGTLIPISDSASHKQIVIQISGSLYFAAARQMPDRLESLLHPDMERLILDLSHTHHCRVAAVQALLSFADQCQAQKVSLSITGASPELQKLAASLGVRLPWTDNHLKLKLSTMWT